jgi:hypothetical protein
MYEMAPTAGVLDEQGERREPVNGQAEDGASGGNRASGENEANRGNLYSVLLYLLITQALTNYSLSALAYLQCLADSGCDNHRLPMRHTLLFGISHYSSCGNAHASIAYAYDYNNKQKFICAYTGTQTEHTAVVTTTVCCMKLSISRAPNNCTEHTALCG